ncbi:hypothetical protein COOONC_00695 [Cooperia oncophora]
MDELSILTKLRGHTIEQPTITGLLYDDDEDDPTWFITARYNYAYGPRLMYVLFVIGTWLSAELFLFWRLTMEHVALLVIQYGLGITKLPSDVRDSRKTRLLPQKLMWEEPLEVVDHGLHGTGLALICFLRFLASHQFSMSYSIELSLQDGRPIPYPILMRQSMWEPLHQGSRIQYMCSKTVVSKEPVVNNFRIPRRPSRSSFSQLAFRTYHHIAVNGRFDSIYIGDIIQDLSESESR